MRPILIFVGTKEGRQLVSNLSRSGIPCIVSLAEEYGREYIPELPGTEVWEGRMSVEEIRRMARRSDVCAIIDATSPESEEVSRDIRQSVEKLHTVGGQAEEFAMRLHKLRVVERGGKKGKLYPGNVLYMRLIEKTGEGEKIERKEGNTLEEIWAEIRELAGIPASDSRPEKTDEEVKLREEQEDRLVFADSEQGFEEIKTGFEKQEERNKDQVEDMALERPSKIQSMWEMERRVNSWIPTMLETGREMPVPPAERTRDYHRILQNYKGNAKPGFSQKKMEDVVDFGNAVYTHQVMPGVSPGHLDRKSSDFSAEERVEERTTSAVAGQAEESEKLLIEIALISVGMGNPKNMTIEAESSLRQAGYVLGAKSLIAHISEEQHPIAAESTEEVMLELEKHTEGKVAILFYGDTGFHSQCREMVKELWNRGYQNLQIYPGVSSVSYFAALCGIEWHDAGIVCPEKKGEFEQWAPEALDSIFSHEKTFLLLPGASDMRALGQLLEENGLEECQVFVGYELSLPGEQTLQMSAAMCRQVQNEGRYVCLVRNNHANEGLRTIPLPNYCFLKDDSQKTDRIPFPDRDVRAAVLSRFDFRRGDRIYDIGSGVGAMAVDIARCHPSLRVFAIEEKPAGIRLIQENCARNHVLNVEIITGRGDEAVKGLPAPTQLYWENCTASSVDALRRLCEKNPGMQVVLTTENLETVGALSSLERELSVKDFEVTQLQISRTNRREAGGRLEMRTSLFLVSFRGGETGVYRGE